MAQRITLTGNSYFWRTANNPGGYVLDSVQLDLTSASGDPSGFTVQLYTGGNYLGAPAPDSSLATLTGSSDPVTAGVYNYAASGLMLNPSTDYFIVLTAGTSVANGAFAWSTEDTAPPDLSGGWPIGDYVRTSSDGLAWNSIAGGVPQFELTATAVPEPDTFVLMGLPGLLFFVWRGWRARAQAR